MAKSIEEMRREYDALHRRNVVPETHEASNVSETTSPGQAFEDYLNCADQRAAEAQEARKRENATLKVCPDCYRKQAKDRQSCELCGKTPARWDPAATDPPNPERCHYVAASTTYTPEELNSYIARSSIDTPFVKHCARVLELMGIRRVQSFWEGAGFDIEGH